MATRPTKRALKAKIEGFLDLAPLAKRFKELEQEIKSDMQVLNLVGQEKAIEIPAKGRVFISQSERTTIPVEIAVDELGEVLADKIILVRKSVSNKLFKAYCETGDIDEIRREAILERAEHKSTISLYVRPLN